jgi:hypothetical protein
MKFNSNPFMILLAIIMILIGAASFLGFRFVPNNQNVTYAILAVAVILLAMVFAGSIKEPVGILLVVLWLGLLAVMFLLKFDFTYSELVLSGLPVGAGFFLLVGI